MNAEINISQADNLLSRNEVLAMAQVLAIFLSILLSFSMLSEQTNAGDSNPLGTPNKSSPIRTQLDEASIPEATKKFINPNSDWKSPVLIYSSKHLELSPLKDGEGIQSGFDEATMNDNTEGVHFESTVLGLAYFFDRLQVTLMTSEEEMQGK